VATFVPPKRGVALTFYVGLVGRSTRPQLQAAPTLAAGDVQVSKDGGAFANLTTLPVVTPAAGRAIKVDLSATEMTADQVVVQFVDAAGAEWDDLFINVQTAARQIDDLAFPVVSGRGVDVDATGGVEVTPNQAVNVAQWNGSAVAVPTVAGVPEVDVTHAAGGAQASIATQASVDAVDNFVDTEITDIQARLPAALVGGRIDSSVGAMAAAVLTAAAIAADAITDAKVAADVTIASVTGSVGSVVGAVGSVAAGGITAPSFALDAIDAAALKADAVTEIRDAVFARAFSAAYDNLTFDQLVKLMAAALLAKCSGMATATGTFRNLADTADTIVATQDTDGNRTAVTRTP